MKHEIQRNKLVTQSGRNRESPDLLILTSRMQKSITIQHKKVQPFLFLSVIYLYNFTDQLGSQRLHKFGYNWDEHNHSLSLALPSLDARCSSLHRFGVCNASVHKFRY